MQIDDDVLPVVDSGERCIPIVSLSSRNSYNLVYFLTLLLSNFKYYYYFFWSFLFVCACLTLFLYLSLVCFCLSVRPSVRLSVRPSVCLCFPYVRNILYLEHVSSMCVYVRTIMVVIILKIKIHSPSSCEIEDFVETHLCKLCVILRSRVSRAVCPHEGYRSATPLATTL